MGLDNTANPADIKKAYRKLILKMHPDKVRKIFYIKGGDPEQFKEL